MEKWLLERVWVWKRLEEEGGSEVGSGRWESSAAQSQAAGAHIGMYLAWKCAVLGFN